MFRSVFQQRTINGDHSTPHLLLCNFLFQNPLSLLLVRVSIRSLSPSSTSQNNSSSSFVVSYLVNSCGLSEEKAISASKKLQFKTSSKPDSVLTFLDSNGFTKPHISKLITNFPSVLLYHPHKTLKPKFDFFNSRGLSGNDLVMVLSRDSCFFLNRSLENRIIPTFAFLKSILHSDKNVISAVKRLPAVLKQVPETTMAPNIELLRDQGVPESNITTLLITQPIVLLLNVDRFKGYVEDIREMGIHSSKTIFVQALIALTSMTKSNWEAKLNVYRRWGLSGDEIQAAIRIHPFCMTSSEKKIIRVMDFFVNQMGYNPSLMAKHPMLFRYSLEKRTIPRCRVIQILVSKGLIKNNLSIGTVISKTEKSFLERYVIKYEKDVPQLLKAYQGQLDCVEAEQPKN